MGNPWKSKDESVTVTMSIKNANVLQSNEAGLREHVGLGVRKSGANLTFKAYRTYTAGLR